MMDRALRDGYEVHRSALAHGYDVVLLPRQVMEVEHEPTGVKTAFSHGIPQQTTLAAVTYAQDVRMRRDMVMRAGYAVPTGATFSMGGSLKAAFRYAEEKLGFPVVMKPAVGDNTIDVISGINNVEELQRAVEFFYTPPTERPGYTRAAYALTELREPGITEDGRVVVPPGYRFLLEKQVAGEYLRFLVLDGEIINVLHCPDGPWRSSPEAIRDITAEVHPSLNQIAAGVTAAIPGISLAAIDLVVADHTKPAEAADAPVVEYSERPWLQVQHACDAALAQQLADRILAFGLDSPLTDLRSTVRVEFQIYGSVHPQDLLVALSEEFAEAEVSGRAELEDQAMGTITGEVTGDPAEIARIMEELLDTGIRGQRAMLVETRHAP
ncbi:hypothetical protein GCM10011359_27700 [Nesterenkonia alkaliphila]|nr:hypothetical protein GCM10011359_27700 [Nesterenkonia alkaliphila]